jgi:DNA-binding NtrC family response regulator
MSTGFVDLSGAKILIVDDVPSNLELLSDTLEAKGYDISVAPGGEVALRLVRVARPDLILLDVQMPDLDGFEVCRRLKADEATRDIPVVYITAHGQTGEVVQGFQSGGVDYILKPFRKEEVLVRVRTHLENARLAQTLAEQNEARREEIARRQAVTSERDRLAERLSVLSRREAERWGIEGFVGKSGTMQTILKTVETLQSAGATSTSALVVGESGTGKELVARAIHFGSRRASGPFLPLNCSTIPTEMAESLLFGHVRGAFTGADRDQAGYFDLADGGTLFLDEIGEMPVDVQVKLLRVIEDGRVLPLGARGAG